MGLNKNKNMKKVYILLEKEMKKNPDIKDIIGKTLTYSLSINYHKKNLSDDEKFNYICNYFNTYINKYKKANETSVFVKNLESEVFEEIMFDEPDSKIKALDTIYDELLKLRDKI
jgi:hypothetical protein